MSNFITDVRIENFKSIKKIAFPAKRINVFIGEPNTGKTNILEALSLFAIPFVEDDSLGLKDFIRMESIYNLFYEQESTENILIALGNDLAESVCKSSFKTNYLDISFDHMSKSKNHHPNNSDLSKKSANFTMGIRGDTRRYSNEIATFLETKIPIIKPYYFSNSIINKSYVNLQFLSPPYGKNLTEIILKNRELRKIIAPIFEEYGFELLLRQAERTIELQKRKDGIMIGYPYSTISDSY